MPIGSDANISLNTDPNLVPNQPAVSTIVGGGYNPRNQPQVPLSQMPPQPGGPVMGPNLPPGGLPGQTPQQGGFMGILQALGALFQGLGNRGAPGAVNGGMTGMLNQPRGQGRPGTDVLGNPTNRF